ncbi:MAG: hypothetical protein Q8K75_01065 [Chlamydiales bacterium]|nr:hypothetical protein [Chlamydiales bacterium]
MSSPLTDLEILVSHYEPTLGIAGARRLIQTTLIKCGLSHKKAFTVDEMAVICGILQLESGFIATTANILLARLRLRLWRSKAANLLEPASSSEE